MNSRLQNQLNMVGACINLAQSNDYQSIWKNQQPADFGTDLDTLANAYGAVTAKAAQVDAATGGASDAKAAAETVLEDAAYVLARALANHFKKTGDLDRRGKIDYSKSEIVRLRAQDLVTQTTAIRDVAQSAANEAGAAGRGVTAASIAALTAAIAAYSAVMNTPRGQIVNRSALLKEIETDIAGLLDQVASMDDLVVQFGASPAGERFAQAWKSARIIVDAGGGRETTAPAPAVPPAPSSPASA